MTFEGTQIAGLQAVRLDWIEDERGGFARLFCAEDFAAHGLFAAVAQSSLSVSRRAGTLRGLHFQRPPHTEAKLVRCVRGAMFDVVADLRPESPSYLRWQGFRLDPATPLALCIPPGCAHGFQTLEDDTEALYQISAPYAASHADGVRFDEPLLGIVWPREISLISPKDLCWPLLRERAAPF